MLHATPLHTLPPLRTATRAFGALLGAFLLLVATARAHDPHDVVRRLAVSPAFPQDGTVVAVVLLDDHWLFARTRDAGRSWQVYGLPLIADDVTWLAFSPTYAHDHTIFASTANGGVWRSKDGGTTFQRTSDGLTDLRVARVAASPAFAADRLAIAVTHSGVFRSLDGGERWAPANDGLTDPALNAVAFGPAPPSDDPGRPSDGRAPTVFVAGKVLQRSDDGGASWTPLHTFESPVASLAVSPAFREDATLAVAFGRYGGGVQVSRDGGGRWSPMLEGLTDDAVNDVAIAPGGTLFAASQTVGCFRAEKAGAPWVALEEGLEPIASQQSSSHFLVVAASPGFEKDRTVFMASFEGCYVSRDAGEHWDQGNLFSERLSMRAAFSPDWARDRRLVLGNFGGGPMFWLGGDPARLEGETASAARESATGDGAEGRLWEARASGITSLYTDELVLSPAYATDRTLFDAYVGTWRSTDDGEHWTRLMLPILITRTIALSPGFAVDRTLFAGSDREGVARSRDAGDTWTLLAGLSPDLDVTRIAASPAFPTDRTLLLSTSNDGLWRSANAGDTWSKASEGLGTESLHTVVFSPEFAEDRTVFAGANGAGVFVSHDGGERWAAANTGLPEGVPLMVDSLAVSPAWRSDRTVFVALLDDGVFRSTDGGESWSRASGGLPLTAFRALAVSPDFPRDRTVLLTTHDGAWLSTDAGERWQRLPVHARIDDSLPQVKSTGTWNGAVGEGFQGPGCRVTKSPGASVELEFHGRSITWFSRKGPGEGTAEIFLDGKSMGRLDLSGAKAVPQVRAFEHTFPGAGWHTIRVVNAGPLPGNPSPTLATDGFAYDD